MQYKHQHTAQNEYKNTGPKWIQPSQTRTHAPVIYAHNRHKSHFTFTRQEENDYPLYPLLNDGLLCISNIPFRVGHVGGGYHKPPCDLYSLCVSGYFLIFLFLFCFYTAFNRYAFSLLSSSFVYSSLLWVFFWMYLNHLLFNIFFSKGRPCLC